MFWDAISSLSTAGAFALGVYSVWRINRLERPIVKAERWYLSFDHDRKDQRIIRVGITAGEHPVHIGKVRVKGYEVCLTKWGGPSDREPGRDSLEQCLDGNFAAEREVDWSVPGRRYAPQPLSVFVCVRRCGGSGQGPLADTDADNICVELISSKPKALISAQIIRAS